MIVSRSIRQKPTLVLMTVLAACLWPHLALAQPKRPDNAALLYFQACAYRSMAGEQPNDSWLMERGDRDPGSDVRQFVNQQVCREAIALVEAAADISACDWGVMASGKWRAGLFAVRFRPLGGLLSLDAMVQAADGQFLPALEVALRLRRFAKHVGDETYIIWTISEELEGRAFRLIQHVLGAMPPDVDTLAWLKSQIDHEEGLVWNPRKALAKWREIEIRSWQVSPEMYAPWKDMCLRTMTDPNAVAELKGLSDTELLERIRAAHDDFLARVSAILEGDRSYQDTCEQITQLMEQVGAEEKDGNPIAFLYSCVYTAKVYYTIHTNVKAHANAVRAAMEVYRIKAETGRLPEALPDGLPGDPYSGEDFDYEITEEGFTLRCRAMAVNYSQGPRHFDFKVHEGNAN